MGKTAIIGFGSGGYHAARSLRTRCPDERIDVYTDTVDAPANPMLTTYYVAGKIERNILMPFGSIEDIANELNLQLCKKKVSYLSAEKRTVIMDDGEQRTYDNIVIATGSHPVVPPIKGLPSDRTGIYVMRTIADADRLLGAVKNGKVKSALVVGASWVGIKVVEALYAHGVPTVLADMASTIFPTAALPQVAEIIHQRLTEMGIGLKFGSGISSVTPNGNSLVSTFSDGTEISSSIVVLCLGLKPTLDMIDPSEFVMRSGLVVDKQMRTSVPHIYAVGDCCEAEELISGQPMVVNLWANAVSQGEIAGRNIAGDKAEFQGNFMHNITHFLNIDFIGLGDNRVCGQHIEYVHPVDGWQFHAIVKDNSIVCINILDNHRLSGAAKAALIKRFTAPNEPLGSMALLALKKSGLPNSIISKIGGSEK